MRWVRYMLFGLITLSACEKAAQVTNLNNNKVAVIGHAGNGIPGVNNDLPMNSWDGILKALEIYNADGVELDTKLSADSVLFLYHDREMDALSNCSGCIYNYQSEDVAQCTFKPVTNALEPKQYIIKLETVLERYKNSTTKPIIFIDLHAALGCDMSGSKKKEYYTTMLYAINALLSRYNAYDQVMVQANSMEWMMESRTMCPDIKVFLDGDISNSDIDKVAANGFYGVASKDENISKEEVEYAHAKGLRVQIYNISGYGVTKAIEKSPDYILADNIPLLQSVLND